MVPPPGGNSSVALSLARNLTDTIALFGAPAVPCAVSWTWSTPVPGCVTLWVILGRVEQFGPTVVVVLDELFEVVGSKGEAVTVAVFETEPSWSVRTVIEMAAKPPLGSVPTLHVTVPEECEHEPTLVLDER